MDLLPYFKYNNCTKLINRGLTYIKFLPKVSSCKITATIPLSCGSYTLNIVFSGNTIVKQSIDNKDISNNFVITDKADLLIDISAKFIGHPHIELLCATLTNLYSDNINPFATSMPLVSILLPMYNAEKTINVCIESLLRQSYKNIEIIIIDDCSTDSSYQICSDYATKYKNIILLKNSSNVGPFVSKNNAYKISNGDYICFQDSDDISHPRRIEKQLSNLLSGKYKLVSCHILRTHMPNIPVHMLDNFDILVNNINNMRKHPNIYCCRDKLGLVTSMFHRSLIIDMGRLFHPFRHSADSEFYERFNYIYNKNILDDKQNIHTLFSTNNINNYFLLKETLYYCHEMTDNNITNIYKLNDKKEVKYAYRDMLISKTSIVNFYFNKVYVINLKKDVNKRKTIAKIMAQHNIIYELVDACNGYDLPKELIINRDRYKNLGEIGYIYSWIKILKIAIDNKYTRILCFDDDVMLHNDFTNKFSMFIKNIESIEKRWKILLLGGSQYNWSDVNINNYYLPHHTDGSFAVGVDSSVYTELLESAESFTGVFDSVCLRKLYTKYHNKCFVAYPNIAIADLSLSEINKRSNVDAYYQRFKWIISDYKN